MIGLVLRRLAQAIPTLFLVLAGILELSDRIVVMSDGPIVHETPASQADVGVIGRHMAGHH